MQWKIDNEKLKNEKLKEIEGCDENIVTTKTKIIGKLWNKIKFYIEDQGRYIKISQKSL